MDKSTLYGFSLPKGTWMVMLSISNDDLWSKIKSGELKGLSIEGYFTNKFEQMQKKEPTDQQILSALNEMIQSKTELKAEKVELGAIDDLKKFNDEARKLIEVLSQGNTDVSEEYQLVKNKARDYNRLNKSYRDDVKKGKAAFKNLKGSISEVEKAVKELGLKPNDIPEFSSSSRALDVLRGLSMDAVNYPDIEI
jgi:DNA repair exonuclease SbcCD ATPase subunit